MANQPIPVSTANAMISDYIAYMTKLGVDMNNQTQNVAFDGTILMNWLGTVMPYADELRVCMGQYPSGNAQAGRTTVILWPYKNGQPATMPSPPIGGSGGMTPADDQTIDPFNDGHSHP
ncbi:MAG: hypothetical protein Q8941_06420 [Bacteroidota bacterium]|nr:hypothetical protein [Bacteroidota bacterium]